MDLTQLVFDLVVRPALAHSVRYVYRTLNARWCLRSQMPKVNRSWNQVRDELTEVGLLYDPSDEHDGGYLEQIELEVAVLPSNGEAGYVCEELGWLSYLAGYSEGVIYLPGDLPRSAYVPGGTLTDVIRHEYAHAWHWVEPGFFDTGWFNRAFGGDYEEGDVTPLDLWSDRKGRSRDFRRRIKTCRNNTERAAVLKKSLQRDFVSEYASTLFCEDFAETFMMFLRYRNSLDRFQSRTGVFKKLKAVERAVCRAKRELGV